LESICSNLNIRIIYPTAITKDNGWFSGFFDADGTITYSMKDNYPQLTISVTNKLLVDVSAFKDVLVVMYILIKVKWLLQMIYTSKNWYRAFKSYLMKYPIFSNKKQRFF
jgi:ubiquinol-cytochrome c reductase cytochrome b subunit